MFSHGIVTFDARVDDDEPRAVYLKVPNEIVRRQLLESIRRGLDIRPVNVAHLFAAPTADALESYMESIFASASMEDALGNDVGEVVIQTVMEAVLRGWADVRCGSDGDDMTILLDDVAVLLAFKRIRPSAMCNQQNRDTYAWISWAFRDRARTPYYLFSSVDKLSRKIVEAWISSAAR